MGIVALEAYGADSVKQLERKMQALAQGISEMDGGFCLRAALSMYSGKNMAERVESHLHGTEDRAKQHQSCGADSNFGLSY